MVCVYVACVCVCVALCECLKLAWMYHRNAKERSRAAGSYQKDIEVAIRVEECASASFPQRVPGRTRLCSPQLEATELPRGCLTPHRSLLWVLWVPRAQMVLRERSGAAWLGDETDVASVQQ